MRTSGLFLLLATFLVLSPIGIRAQNKIKQNSNEQALINLINQTIKAQTNFDATSLDKIYASDYIEVSPVGEVDLREKAVGFYKTQVPDGSVKTSSTADDFLVRFYKDFAVIIARITFLQGGSDIPVRSLASFRATYVCRKEKGKWKISSVQFTGIRPPRPLQTK